MKDSGQLFDKLWFDYSTMNKQAGIIHFELEKRGEQIVNDHVAFRTFNSKKVSIDKLARHFIKLGYHEASGKGYHFKDKKLFAKHFQHDEPNRPKIFISELIVEDFPAKLQSTIQNLIDQIPESLTQNAEFLISGTPWKKISWQTYQDLLKESEYAAWMAAFGFRVNHFTIFYNSLKTFKDLSDLNEFVKKLGFPLNAAGGEIKGTKNVYLEQSSTLAYQVEVEFADKKEKIPACYYEFAKRYVMPDGKLFQAFLPESADKIFESTN